MQTIVIALIYKVYVFQSYPRLVVLGTVALGLLLFYLFLNSVYTASIGIIFLLVYVIFVFVTVLSFSCRALLVIKVLAGWLGWFARFMGLVRR